MPKAKEETKETAEEVLAEAKAAAEEIVANAKAEVAKMMENVKANVSAEKVEDDSEEKARMEELVTIKLFKDGDKYKDDLFVAVNGENCLIKRGIPVQIKRKFALAIENSENQDAKTIAFMEAQEKEFERQAKANNIL